MGRAKRPAADFQQKWIAQDPHHSNFFRVYSDLFHAPAFRSLTKNAQLLYIAMGLEAKGKTVFKFPFSAYSKLMSKRGFETAKQQLVDSGFITEKRYRTVPNEYSFCADWKEKSISTVSCVAKRPP